MIDRQALVEQLRERRDRYYRLGGEFNTAYGRECDLLAGQIERGDFPVRTSEYRHRQLR